MTKPFSALDSQSLFMRPARKARPILGVLTKLKLPACGASLLGFKSQLCLLLAGSSWAKLVNFSAPQLLPLYNRAGDEDLEHTTVMKMK